MHPLPPAHSSSRNSVPLWAKVMMWVVVGSLCVTASALIAVYRYKHHLSQTFDDRKTVISEALPDRDTVDDTQTPDEISGVQTILLLGSDSRGNPDDARSDTIMVVRIPEKRDSAYVMSFLRDSWVDIPGYGYDKINAAFAYGGLPLAVETIEEHLSTRIDHVIMVDFEGFKHVTDALGGVPVHNEIEFSLTNGEGTTDFPVGDLDLNGDQALQFVRERHSFVDGDYQRARNQQLYLRSVLEKFLSAGTLTNPSKITGVVEGLSPYLSVDEGVTADYLVSLVWTLRTLSTDDIVFFTVPTLGTELTEDEVSIINLDYERLEELAESFHNDTLDKYVQTHDLSEY